MTIQPESLPRLLYVGDVPVEASYHGSALLYRLLERYPADQLRVVEGNLLLSEPPRRLPNVRYDILQQGHPRLLRTRFAKAYSSWLTLRARASARRLTKAFVEFRPEAVLTAIHGYSWLTADEFAQRHELPLHIVMHDDWPSFANVFAVIRECVNSEFSKAYRRAISRFCVSPGMCDIYQKRFGVEGSVLYPSRATDSVAHHTPPARLERSSGPFAVAFAGTINTGGYARALRNLAKQLEAIDGHLIIFGPLNKANAQAVGLAKQNVELRGLVSAAELQVRLRDEADVLFAPMSFDDADRVNMGMGFPSKLADYTTVGLPLLIQGPSYCSAVRWARENPGVAEVVETESEDGLRAALNRLATDSAHRMALARKAIEVGRRYFSAETAQQILYSALLGKKDRPMQQLAEATA